MEQFRFPSKLLLPLLGLGVLLLGGCLNAPAEDVAVQEVLLETDFAGGSGWPVMIDTETGTAAQLTTDGYQLTSESAQYIWGFSEESYANVVLETAVRQLSAEQNNAYGLVCRANSSFNENGYYFLVSGDGLVSIRRVERGLSSPIVDWTPHRAVRQGEQSNRLRAICTGEYLALYVNGQLAAEGRDGRFPEGLIGVAASGSEDGPIQVNFSELTVWAAEISR